MSNRSARNRTPAVPIHQAVARDPGVAIPTRRHKLGDNLQGEIERAEQLGALHAAHREAVQ